MWHYPWDTSHCASCTILNSTVDEQIAVNGMQCWGQWTNRPPLWRGLASVNHNTCHSIALRSYWAVLLTNWYRYLFACKMYINGVVLLGWLPLTQFHLQQFSCGFEGFPSSWCDTFIDFKLMGYSHHTTPLLKLVDNSTKNYVNRFL